MRIYLQAGLLSNVLDGSRCRRPTAVGIHRRFTRDEREEEEVRLLRRREKQKTEMTKNNNNNNNTVRNGRTHTRACNRHTRDTRVDLINAPDDNDYCDDENNNNMSIARGNELKPAGRESPPPPPPHTKYVIIYILPFRFTLSQRSFSGLARPSPVTRGLSGARRYNKRN